MIRETIITTLNGDGTVHIAPMGIREEQGMIIIAPFKPSTTLENISRSKYAVVNLTDDVRVFAGCLTGHYEWPTRPVSMIEGQRLSQALSHMELKVARLEDDKLRPRFHCQVVNQEIHESFSGFNRAQSAVLEGAILVSRLHMLPREKIETEIGYLESAIEKTAGPDEQLAWSWLMTRIQEFYTDQSAGEKVI